MTIPEFATSLEPAAILKSLHALTEQLGLFDLDRNLDKFRCITFHQVLSSISPTDAHPPSMITFRNAQKALAGLWFYTSRMGLFSEIQFDVLDVGILVAWGQVTYTGPPSPTGNLLALPSGATS